MAGSRDASDRLAARSDIMLGKVERLMTELRLLTDGLAHDQRLPTARLRTGAEQALLADPAAREGALGGLLAETDLVMRILTTAVDIRRSGSAAATGCSPPPPLPRSPRLPR